jgi:hypothetical protein
MIKKIKKLSVKSETIRKLGVTEIRRAHGGLPTDPATNGDTGCQSEATGCPTPTDNERCHTLNRHCISELPRC